MQDGSVLTCAPAQVGRDPGEGIGLEASEHLFIAPDMLDVLGQLQRLVQQETTVVITGEAGTGKIRLARLIHDLSPRRKEPFLVVPCGALSPTRLGSELFGHLQGAFPGADTERRGKLAEAGQGTLVLHEVGALPLAVQARLLHAVDERVFEPLGANSGQPLGARLMATSSVPLMVMVNSGQFREELWYRLNIVSICLPSLRDYPAAVADMAFKLLELFAGRHHSQPSGIAREALRALQAYAWPGNIPELRRVMEQAVAACQGSEILLTDLPESVRRPLPRRSGTKNTPGRMVLSGPSAGETLAHCNAATELLRITQALRNHGNNRSRAAAELGISRMSLYKKLLKYGLVDLPRTRLTP